MEGLIGLCLVGNLSISLCSILVFQFPFLGILKKFYEFLVIHPSQLMPNTLWVVISVDRLVKLYMFDCEVRDLFQVCSTKKQFGDLDGYVFFKKQGCNITLSFDV